MNRSVGEVLEQILQVQPVLHSAGTVSRDALTALARHAGTRTIRRSVETGCGATTLLLSHLSENHTVFALDVGGSVANVRRSPLLRKDAVTFVEGPSQRTLPQHRFDDKLQLALVDGPHAYPFPDLEYYFLYPHLDHGALLVLDDIHIPTIHNLFQFLRTDEMFQLDEVVRTTAFFTRTAAPTFDPAGDAWRDQRYNRRPLQRYAWRSTLSNLLPRATRRRLTAYRHAGRQRGSRCFVEIVSPARAEHVAEIGVVRGRATLSSGAYLWVLAHRKDVDGWWPQGNGPAAIAGDSWSVEVHYGGPQDAGFPFEIAAVVVTRAVHESWLAWVRDANNTGRYPPVALPMAPHALADAFQTVYKQR